MHKRTSLTPEERTALKRVKQRDDRMRRAARTADQIGRDRLRRHPDGTKRCNRCKKDLPFDRFTPFPREQDGLHTHCTECARSRASSPPNSLP